MVSIPAPGGGRRYEFMIMPGEDPAAMATPQSIASVLARFREISGSDILRGVVYTFHARVAGRLSQGRVVLLGDAAHLSPPFAGQGMNAGLRDAFNVAWKVAAAAKGLVAPGILATYEAERRKPIVEMIEYAVALGAIVMPTGRFDDRTREAIAAALAGESADGTRVDLRPRPQAVYEEGWLRRNAGSGQGLVGRPLPQPTVRRADGSSCRLDDVFGPGPAVVGVGNECAEALSHLRHSPWHELGARRVLVRSATAETAAGADLTVVELADDGHSGLAGHSGQLFGVRPDRFVAAQGPAERPGEFGDLLARLVAADGHAKA